MLGLGDYLLFNDWCMIIIYGDDVDYDMVVNDNDVAW